MGGKNRTGINLEKGQYLMLKGLMEIIFPWKVFTFRHQNYKTLEPKIRLMVTKEMIGEAPQWFASPPGRDVNKISKPLNCDGVSRRTLFEESETISCCYRLIPDVLRLIYGLAYCLNQSQHLLSSFTTVYYGEISHDLKSLVIRHPLWGDT